ncbi:hypothetical protein R6Q57_023289 [Mikania cordata]
MPYAIMVLAQGALCQQSLEYKGWGSLLGFQLAERDIIVTCIDYRNFPQGTIGDMVEDVSQGISYVCNNIANYGGDPNRIYLMGQSAGAHISSCVLLKKAIKESKGENVSWSVSQIQAYFGLSGGYNLTNLVDHFDRRGLYRSIFLSIMEGDKSLQQFSPEILIEDPSASNVVPLLPHIVLFHGTKDFSIPPDSSIMCLCLLSYSLEYLAYGWWWWPKVLVGMTDGGVDGWGGRRWWADRQWWRMVVVASGGGGDRRWWSTVVAVAVVANDGG